MKTIKLLFAMIIASLATTTVKAQADTAINNPGFKTQIIKVFGECGMCKSRIEKAALKVDGIKSANWDEDTQRLTVNYEESNKDVIDKLQKKIAKVGHDTEAYKADDKVYNALPACCHYERRP